MFNRFFTGFDLAFVLTMAVILVTTIVSYKLGKVDGYDTAIEDVEEGRINVKVRNHRALRRHR